MVHAPPRAKDSIGPPSRLVVEVVRVCFFGLHLVDVKDSEGPSEGRIEEEGRCKTDASLVDQWSTKSFNLGLGMTIFRGASGLAARMFGMRLGCSASHIASYFS